MTFGDKQIDKIALGTASILIDMYINHKKNNHCIIYPYYRDGTKKNDSGYRVSEQEARFVFVRELDHLIFDNNLDICYSVETPTRYRYSGFTGSKDNVKDPKVFFCNEGGISGNTDVSIHKFPYLVDRTSNSDDTIFRIEFKCGNPILKSYVKDFLKLYSEKATGVWFQVLEGSEEAKRRTITRMVSESKKALQISSETDKSQKYRNTTDIKVYFLWLGEKKSNIKPTFESGIISPNKDLVVKQSYTINGSNLILKK